MTRTVTGMASLGVYRDGGSLTACFKSQEENIQHCLFFPIDRSPAFEPNLKHPIYKLPVLKTYTSVPYVSPVTGISTPDTRLETVAISWEEARGLLNQMRPHMVGFESDYAWVFESMAAAASAEGKPGEP